MSVPKTSSRDDRVLIETRVVAAIVIPVLLLAFVILYLNPDQTNLHFAWTIKPNMTPIAMGAGYLMGAYFFARVIAGWLMLPGIGALYLSREMRWSGWRVVVEATTIGGVTLIFGILRAWNDWNTANPFSILIAIAIGVTLMLAPVLWVNQENRRRKTANA